MYLGSREIDDTLVFTCQTHAADTQVSTDADSAPSYRVYEDETGTAILTGSMALLDDANTVGQYSEQITLSAANGFEQGKSYTVRIQATVGGVTGATDRHFQVGAKVNVTRLAGTAQTARDIGASVLLSPGTGTGQLSLTSGAVLLQATQTGVTIPTVTTLTNAPSDSSGVTTLLSRVTGAVALASDLATLAAKFSGITLIRHWLGAIMGKQTADSTALTEINASGAGSGTYNPVDDSLEALKDGSATLAEVTAATSHPVVLSWELQRAVPVSRFLALGSATGSILTNPTIASGDWKISKDGGAFANLATLPDVEPDGTNQVRLQLSESELDAEWIVILGIDQTATKEWRDVLITIKVTGATVKVVTDGSNAAGTFKISRFGLGTEATDMLKTAYLKPLTGALAGQVQKVTAYNSTTDFVTVSPDFTGIPADGVYMQVVNG